MRKSTPRSDHRPPRRGLILALASLAALLAIAALVAAAATVSGSSPGRWIDGASIDVDASQLEPRRVLWEPAREVPGAINSDLDEYEPRLSADGTTLLLVRRRPGSDSDIFMSRWSAAGWTDPIPLDAVNSDADELGPVLSFDGRTLWFASNRPGGQGGFDLWISRRLDVIEGVLDGAESSQWSSATNLGTLLNTTFNEYGPALTPRGDRLFFSSNRPREQEARPISSDPWIATIRERRTRPDYDLFVTALDEGEPRDAAEPLDVNTPFDEGAPAVSPAGDFLWFASDRPRDTADSQSDFDLFRARLRDGQVREPERLDEAINSLWNELDPALGAEGFRVFFSSDRANPIAGEPPGEGIPPSAAGSSGPRVEYDLWTSVSREVWLDQAPRSSILATFSELLAAWWPLLLLLLLAALLLFLLWRALRGADWRTRFARLSLLARCLLLSLLAHAAICLLLAAWQVGVGVGEALRGGGGGMQIDLTSFSLASKARDQLGEELGEQIRASITTTPSLEDVAASPDLALDALAVVAAPTLAVAPADVPRRDVEESSLSTEAALIAMASEIDLAAVLPEVTRPVAQEDEPKESHAPKAPAQAAMRAPSSVPSESAPLALGALRLDPAVREVVGDEATGAELPRTAERSAEAIDSEILAALPEAPRPITPADVSDGRRTAPRPSATAMRAPAAAPTAIIPAAVEALRVVPPSAPASRVDASTMDRPSAAEALWDSAGAEGDRPSGLLASETGLDGAQSALSDAGLPAVPEPVEDFSQRGAEVREALVEGLGGSSATEEAVARALIWFARHQSRDGRWSSRGFEAAAHADAATPSGAAPDTGARCDGASEVDMDVATTSLALLCFLSSGATHESEGPHREVIRRGLDWIVSRQSADGDLRRRDDGSRETMYGQTIAAVALCEAFSMTRDVILAVPAQRAVALVMKRAIASREGRAEPEDTSVIGWQVMCFESARRAGIGFGAETMAAARRWLEEVADPARHGRYAPRRGAGHTVEMTAEALFATQLLDQFQQREPDAPRAAHSIEFILSAPPRWIDGAPTHHWYYATLALFQEQGDAWQQWNEALAPVLVERQRRDGCAEGSWDPADEWARLGGRAYQTAVCTLSLQVYYRYRVR